jgi:lipopolysaccharide exporter
LGIFAIGAPFVAAFFHEPKLKLLTMALALNFPLGAIAVIQYTLLQKHMEFRRIGMFGMASCIGSGVVAVFAAWRGFGVWSLVAQQLSSTVIATILFVVFNPWRPTARFQMSALKHVLRFSLSVFSFNVFNYFIRNAGNVILGRSLGAVAVGLYNRSYSIMLLPLSFVSYRVGEVLFPAFCAIQESPKRVAHVYLRTIQVIGFLTFPMMIGLWALSDRFVLTVLGAKWAEIIPLLKVGCIVGMVESIGAMNGALYLGRGAAKLRLKVVLVIAPLSVAAMVVGLKWGVTGVMYGYAIYSLLITYPSIQIPVALVGLNLWDVTKALGGVFAAAVGMGVAVYFLAGAAPAGASWIWFVALVAAGAAIYLAIVWSFRVTAFQELTGLLSQQFKKLRAVPAGP